MQDFTVREIAEALKIEQTDEAMWYLGTLIRERWRSEFGELPKKELKSKKNGGGSHCYATYPASFWRQAHEVASRYQGIQKLQLELGLASTERP